MPAEHVASVGSVQEHKVQREVQDLRFLDKKVNMDRKWAHLRRAGFLHRRDSFVKRELVIPQLCKRLAIHGGT
jgi:hypothetical protein